MICLFPQAGLKAAPWWMSGLVVSEGFDGTGNSQLTRFGFCVWYGFHF